MLIFSIDPAELELLSDILFIPELDFEELEDFFELELFSEELEDFSEELELFFEELELFFEELDSSGSSSSELELLSGVDSFMNDAKPQNSSSS